MLRPWAAGAAGPAALAGAGSAEYRLGSLTKSSQASATAVSATSAGDEPVRVASWLTRGRGEVAAEPDDGVEDGLGEGCLEVGARQQPCPAPGW